MAPQVLPGGPGRRDTGRPMALVAQGLLRPAYVIPGMAFAGVSLLLWSRSRIDETSISLMEDRNVARFSDYCVAPGDGAEGAMPLASEGGPELRDVVVLFAHGDSSPELAWQGDEPVSWSCAPEALPRYWKRNEDLDFQVIAPNGSRVNTSFTPDMLEGGDTEAAPRPYTCAGGQLTPFGFRSMAALGRHLANAYGDHLTSADKLHVESVNAKRSLASAVGVVMALLTTPRAHELFPAGAALPIRLRPEALVPEAAHHPPGPDALEALLGGRSPDEVGLTSTQIVSVGDHLLSRWCHQLPLPCRAGACVSMEAAAEIVARGERGVCQSLPQLVASSSRLLKQVGQLAAGNEGRSLSLVSVDVRSLTGALLSLLGEAGCKSSEHLRPPLGSRLVFERWHDGAGARWRVLWNGGDITDGVGGCDSKFPPGCDDAMMQRTLLR